MAQNVISWDSVEESLEQCKHLKLDSVVLNHSPMSQYPTEQTNFVGFTRFKSEQHKCLLNMGTADLYGSNDPFQVVSELILLKNANFHEIISEDAALTQAAGQQPQGGGFHRQGSFTCPFQGLFSTT